MEGHEPLTTGHHLSDLIDTHRGRRWAEVDSVAGAGSWCTAGIVPPLPFNNNYDHHGTSRTMWAYSDLTHIKYHP